MVREQRLWEVGEGGEVLTAHPASVHFGNPRESAMKIGEEGEGFIPVIAVGVFNIVRTLINLLHIY